MIQICVLPKLKGLINTVTQLSIQFILLRFTFSDTNKIINIEQLSLRGQSRPFPRSVRRLMGGIDTVRAPPTVGFIQSFYRGYRQRRQWLKEKLKIKSAIQRKEESVFKVDIVYILDVSIIKGTNLPSKGSNDSFVRLKCNDQVFDTKVINNSLNPDWEGTTRFRFEMAPKMVYFNVFSGEDKIIHHGLVGHYAQSLDEYFQRDNPGNDSVNHIFNLRI